MEQGAPKKRGRKKKPRTVDELKIPEDLKELIKKTAVPAGLKYRELTLEDRAQYWTADEARDHIGHDRFRELVKTLMDEDMLEDDWDAPDEHGKPGKKPVLDELKKPRKKLRRDLGEKLLETRRTQISVHRLVHEGVVYLTEAGDHPTLIGFSKFLERRAKTEGAELEYSDGGLNDLIKKFFGYRWDQETDKSSDKKWNSADFFDLCKKVSELPPMWHPASVFKPNFRHPTRDIGVKTQEGGT